MLKTEWSTGLAILLWFTALTSVSLSQSTETLRDSQTDQQALLPRSIVAAFSIVDCENWRVSWQATGLQKFFDHPGVQSYLKDISSRASHDAAWLRLILPGGPNHDSPTVDGALTYSLIGTSGRYEHLLQIECTDPASAQRWIAQMTKRLAAEGFNRDQASSVPPLQVLKSQQQGSGVTFAHRGRRAFACTSAPVLKQLFSSNFKPLVGSSEFESTVVKGLKRFDHPTFWWFVRPFELSRGNADDAGAAKNYAMMRGQGFDAFQAIGGAGSIDRRTKRIRSTGYIAIKQPLQKAARMLKMHETAMPTIPNWCRAATSCGFANIDLAKFLENYSTMFDALYGEGEQGVFDAVLEDLKQRNDGPKVDLQNELFGLLQGPVYFATIQGESSAPKIIAVAAKDAHAVARSVKRLFQGDSRALDQSEGSRVTWKIMPIEDGYGIKEPVVISIRGGTVFIAPNVAVIDYLETQSGATDQFGARMNIATGRFGYQLDFDRFVGRFWQQLKKRQLSPAVDSVLTRMNLKQAVLAADSARLPSYEDIKDSFDSVFSIICTGTDQWKLEIESR